MEENLKKLLEDTQPKTCIDKKVPLPRRQEDIIKIEQPINAVSTITIESCLKDLMKIRRPRVENSKLLNGIDRVSNSIEGCINLAESTLQRKKLALRFKKTTRKNKPSEDIFSSIDHIDEKIRHCQTQ